MNGTERTKQNQEWIPSQIAQIDIECTNLTLAEDFYCQTLGLSVVSKLPQIGTLLVKCGTTDLLIRQTIAPSKSPTIYFNADNHIFDATSTLSVAGIKFTEQPHCIAKNRNGFDIWLGLFEDPWSNLLGLIAKMPLDSVPKYATETK